jgi:hypothetical protein
MKKKIQNDFHLADSHLRFKDLKQRGELNKKQAKYKTTLPCILLISATQTTTNDSN